MLDRQASRARRRQGFSLLELQVSFIVLGVALAGVAPLVVMQSRQLQSLEARLDVDQVQYLDPSDDPWARKLGAPAIITTTDPGTTPPPPVTLIDDLDLAYSEIDPGTIDWTTVIDAAAWLGQYRHNYGDALGDTAIWTFTDLPPGWYTVQVTYPANALHATNAPFSAYDDITLLGTTPVDQQTPPTGGTWETLATYKVVSGTLRIELGDNADGEIAADATRVVSVRNEIDVISLTKTTDSEAVSARVDVTQLVP